MKLVKITQTTCSPCKAVSAFLNTFGVETIEWNLDLVKPEVKEFLKNDVGVMGTPTLLLFNVDEIDEDNLPSKEDIVDSVSGKDFPKIQAFLVKAGLMAE